MDQDRYKVKRIGFCWKEVHLKFKNETFAGKYLILGDNVLIDALFKDGVKLGQNDTIACDLKIVCTKVIRNLSI